ncbi:hypothetical protein BH24DEI1_BH24DEI1_15090 [soil metagenome]
MPQAMTILTPDQRMRVFVSSTLQELAEERSAAKEAMGVRVDVHVSSARAALDKPLELRTRMLEPDTVSPGSVAIQVACDSLSRSSRANSLSSKRGSISPALDSPAISLRWSISAAITAPSR